MDPRHDPKAVMAQGTEGQQRLCSSDTAKLSPRAARHLPERPSCLPGAVPHIPCIELGVNGEILLFLDLIPHLAGPGNSLSPAVTQPRAGCARALHQTAPKDGINAGSGRLRAGHGGSPAPNPSVAHPTAPGAAQGGGVGARNCVERPKAFPSAWEEPPWSQAWHAGMPWQLPALPKNGHVPIPPISAYKRTKSPPKRVCPKQNDLRKRIPGPPRIRPGIRGLSSGSKVVPSLGDHPGGNHSTSLAVLGWDNPDLVSPPSHHTLEWQRRAWDGREQLPGESQLIPSFPAASSLAPQARSSPGEQLRGKSRESAEGKTEGAETPARHTHTHPQPKPGSLPGGAGTGHTSVSPNSPGRVPCPPPSATSAAPRAGSALQSELLPSVKPSHRGMLPTGNRDGSRLSFPEIPFQQELGANSPFPSPPAPRK